MHIHYDPIRRLLQIIDYHPLVAAIHLSINSAASKQIYLLLTKSLPQTHLFSYPKWITFKPVGPREKGAVKSYDLQLKRSIVKHFN